MNKWELARYLIDAKVAVDNIWYISNHIEQLRNLEIRELVKERSSKFYINCCAVLDRSKIKKKDICNQNPIIEAIYRERDKYYAHKDDDFISRGFESLQEHVFRLQQQLLQVLEVCKTQLPDAITLDYVPHDEVLFRLVNCVTPEKEDAIIKEKSVTADQVFGVSCISKGIESFVEALKTRRILNDTEDLKSIPEAERDSYAVIFMNGINIFEGLQKRQSACIRVNALFRLEIWCAMTAQHIQDFIRWENLGIFNQFSIPLEPNMSNPAVVEEIKRMQLEDR